MSYRTSVKSWVYPCFGDLKQFYALILRVGVGVRKGEKGGKVKLEVTETGVNSDFSYHSLSTIGQYNSSCIA